MTDLHAGHPETDAASEHPLRRLERERFSASLPLKGLQSRSFRVFNVWGEPGIGKSTFLRGLREETLAERKILWLSPHAPDGIDSIPEFIVACSKAVRYPLRPEKEKPLAKKLERVQRGKVNPIVSDDTMLITRSSLASDKKPYVNKAVAASVGRTIRKEEEIEVSVGLGDNKSGNQAEAFLDALPLQSLGTDLIILHLPQPSSLSVTVRDWICDYVIPAASKGSFRRNLIIITEGTEPQSVLAQNRQWGQWGERTYDFRLYPMSEDDVYLWAIQAKLSPEQARFVYIKSQGFPAIAEGCIRPSAFSRKHAELARQTLSSLSQDQRVRLAACCLPEKINADELDGILGPGQGRAAYDWLKTLKLPIALQPDQAMVVEDDFRYLAIAAVIDLAEFKAARARWAPYGRLLKSVPSKTDRDSLYPLAGLQWIDAQLCQTLFGDRSEEIFAFLEEHPGYFIRNRSRYTVSRRFQSDLLKVAEQLQHPLMASSRNRAKALWEEVKEELDTRIESLRRTIKITNEEINQMVRRQTEANAYLRVLDRQGRSAAARRDWLLASQPSRGPLALALASATVVAVGFALASEGIVRHASLASAAIALLSFLAILPKWIRQRRAKAALGGFAGSTSPDAARRETISLAQQIQSREAAVDELQQDLEEATSLLKFPYA